MTYRLELGYNPYIKAPIEGAVTLPNAELKLLMCSKAYANLSLKIFVRLNGKIKVYNAQAEQVIDLTPILEAGTLEIEINQLIGAKIVKRWEVSPIIISEITPNFVLKDYMSSLEKRIEALEKKHETIL